MTVLLPEIFAQKQRVDAGRVSTHDHVLVIVRENLGLDEITRTEQIRHCSRLANAANSALSKLVCVFEISPLQFLSSQARDLFAFTKTKMPRHIGAFETGQGSQTDIVKLREQKSVDEMPAIDGELRIIDCLFRDLQS